MIEVNKFVYNNGVTLLGGTFTKRKTAQELLDGC